MINIARYSFEFSKLDTTNLLLKVVRTYYRVLNPDEEHIDSQCQELWKSLLSKLQDSVEFVNVQSPNILEQLDSLIKV